MNTSIVPNSTQVPNYIIDELLPLLNDTEFKVLMIVVRQTLGWVEDVETGRRKDRDWISRWQMEKKTGRGHSQVSLAIGNLVDKYKIIDALAEDGTPLDTASKRKMNGGQIFYRLATRRTTLFDTSPKTGQGKRKEGGCPEIGVPRKPDTTKETLITKENTCDPAKPDARGKDNRGVSTLIPKQMGASVHKQFIDFWYLNTRKARRITPIITAQDGKNLKRVLGLGVAQDNLEKAAIYFLHDPSFRTFSPSLSTFLSAGVITGILNRMENEPQFWKKIEQYIGTQGGVALEVKQIAAFADQLTALKHRLTIAKKMPYSVPVH